MHPALLKVQIAILPGFFITFFGYYLPTSLEPADGSIDLP